METKLCLDVGGTEIKAAVVQDNGTLLGEIRYFPANSRESAPVLLDHFAEILQLLARDCETVTGIRMAFPGPFDYEKGISLLQGLDKYDSLYGLELRKELMQRLNLPGIKEEDILFINDVSAFALGEMHFGKAAGAEKSMFICIGTGCGSAFGLDGKLTDERTPGVPKDGYVYPTPFLDSCIDDHLSRRGLLRLSREMMGEELDGKALAQRVQQRDEKARDCFACFGNRLRDALAPFLFSYHPQCLCIGGQITRSADLFLSPLKQLCQENNVLLYVTADTSVKTVQGLSVL